MYAPFFGLQQDAFSIAPDPRFLFMSEMHREALAHLLYGVAGGGGFVLLTGEIGAGKTTVCRCFLDQVPARCNVAYIVNPKLTVVELLRSVCDEFGIAVPAPTPGAAATVKDHLDPLNRFVLAQHAAGRDNLLVIDEAQSLSAEVLEQLRLLTNLETAERKLLQIILIGQPELRNMLARPDLEQLAQRVIARYHLPALTAAETAQYVQHRLAVAGLQGPLPFDGAALRRIHRLTGGVPRRINLLCGRAMLGAYAHGQRRIGARVVDQAAREVFDAGSRPGHRRALAAAAAAGVVFGGAVLFAGLRGGGSGPAAPAAAASVPAVAEATAPGPAQVAAASAPADPAPVSAPDAGTVPTALADEAQAWRELGSLWDATLDGADPCRSAVRERLQCFRSRVGLALIRQLDRPGIVTLRGGGERRGYALLVGLGDDTVTLRMQDGARTLPLAALVPLWRGDFATLWRMPPGYGAGATSGGSAELAGWLAPRLAALPGAAAAASEPAGAAPDMALRAQLSAFQLDHGLKPDGLPGPLTLMMINRASGVSEPRLLGER